MKQLRIVTIIGILITSLLSCNTDVPRSEVGAAALLKAFKSPDTERICIGAHRAHWRFAPENSLPAIQSCIDMGLEMVELDVRISSDSQLIVFHDATLDRMTKRSGDVKTYPLDTLIAIPLQSAIGIETEWTIPTLCEALELCKDKILVKLDKCYEHIEQAYAIVRELSMEDQVIFIATEPYEEVKKRYPEQVDEILVMPAFNCEVKKIPELVSSWSDKPNVVAFEVGFKTEDCPSIAAFDQIKASGKAILVDVLWADLCAGHHDDRAVIDPDGSWGWVIEQGVSNLITDRPQLLLDYLKAHGLHD